jgi:hypothetical protein
MSTRLLNSGNIAQNVYNPSNESIQVSIVGGGSPTMPNVVILSDGVAYLTSTISGPKRALDVNIINEIEIAIDHTEDSIRLGNGVDFITTTTSGLKTAMDVSIQPNGTLKSKYMEVSNVVSGVETLINSYIIPLSGITRLVKVTFSGTNVGRFTLYKNGTAVERLYTYFGNLFSNFDYGVGLIVAPSDLIEVKILHNRPTVGDFNARIDTLEG